MPQLKKGPKIVAYLVAGALGLYGVNYAMQSGLIPKPTPQQSKEAVRVELPGQNLPKESIKTNRSVEPTRVSLPGAVSISSDELRCEVIAWNAQAGLILANGGPSTTSDSLVAQNGSKLRIIKNNDVEQMKKNMVAFATAYADGNPQPSVGVPCVIVMWDGAPGFVTGVNDALERLGAQYKLKNIASFGYSRGEDKLMGPPEWRDNPKLMAGKTMCGYVGDGDWNIGVTYAFNNGVCNNPDVTSYDPDCINWINTNDHIDAAQKYITGFSEDRKVVGKLGETKKVVCDAVVTWTPGDVMVAEQKGGLVSLLSTLENFYQMPSAMLIIDQYAQDNRKNIEGIIDAAFDAGDLIKNNDSKLREASALVAKTYGEQDGNYWYKYYTIQNVKDKKGLMISLGGSQVNNLADNLFAMGLAPDSQNPSLLVQIYDTFGQLFVSQYPDRMEHFVPGEEVVDTSYVKNISLRPNNTRKPLPEPDKPQITQNTRIKQKIADKSYSIEFATGKATFTPQAEEVLQQVLSSLTVSAGLAVKIVGHTDDTGTDIVNKRLSEARAFAVRNWLREHGKGLPNIENAQASGVGSSEPVASNADETGRSQNRRVQIILGSAS